MNFLWVYLLGGLSLIALMTFLFTLSRDVSLSKQLNKGKWAIGVNLLSFFISLGSIFLMIYLFLLLKEQINLIG